LPIDYVSREFKYKSLSNRGEDLLSIAEKYRFDLAFGAHVKLNEEAVSKFSAWISKLQSKAPTPEDWSNPELWLEDSWGQENVSQFFALGNSINFRYWSAGSQGGLNYCEGPKGGKTYRGAFYMWRSLRLFCQKDPSLLDASRLAKITLNEMRTIFKDDSGMDTMPALDERLLNWNDLGAKLRDYWGGKFYNLLKAAGQSLFLFVQFSRQFRAFDDPLCKMTMVNAIMHQQRGLVNFNQKPLPGIDYQLLKQLLRNGILELDKSLEGKVTTGKILGLEEARELRNAGLYSFIQLMKTSGISGDIIDNMYWLNRNACDTESPVCKIHGKENQCIFYGICPERVQLKIPYEMTRYY
jgi:hypothetical protein